MEMVRFSRRAVLCLCSTLVSSHNSYHTRRSTVVPLVKAIHYSHSANRHNTGSRGAVAGGLRGQKIIPSNKQNEIPQAANRVVDELGGLSAIPFL